MFKRFIGYFFAGLAILLPIGLSAYVVYEVVVAVDSLFAVRFPGFGLLFVIVIVTSVGLLASLFVGRPIFEKLESIFIKIPLLGFVYKAFKDLTRAFVGKENKFSEPVMVQLSESEVYKIGFITSRDASFLLKKGSSEHSETLCAVYLPISYSIAGDLYFVPSERIRPLDMSPSEAMQYIVSGGVIDN